MDEVYTGRSRDDTFAGYSDLIVRCCSECAVLYAIPVRMREVAVEKGGSWWCPNGHSQSPTGKTLTERLEEERRRAGLLVAQRDQAEASARAQRAAATRARNERDRIRKRAGAGVCPCCKRTFKQLARHMEAKHPDFDPAEAAAD